VLLGGLAAPTGGQAQGNPVPVLLRLTDLAVLPNGFRGQVKDCLVVAEGFGDSSAERAYIRTTLLSCVMLDGKVLEVPIKGSVFGEDGMNGMSGKLITKQGAILTNALLAGIASGIGGGIAQAAQISSATTLGPINTAPTDAAGILKQGVGTGVGKALDRLAQYYITLAERTFPVIEVQPGRYVDVVLQQGVSVDIALASVGPSGATLPTRGSAADNDRAPLMRVVHGEDDE
jgi:conjugal transfer pilus assembly protein TraB